jgi:hypothetical protein
MSCGLAGVCRTTVQTTLHEARRLNHIAITERPMPGRKHLTNLVAVVFIEWRAWIKRGPCAQRPPGSNSLKIANTTKRKDSVDDGVVVGGAPNGVAAKEVQPSKEALELANELPKIAGHLPERLPSAWKTHDIPQMVERLLVLVAPTAFGERTPACMLRSFFVHIATRRRDVGDPPRSPSYFDVAVRRWSAELEQSLARPLRDTGAA